MGDDPSQSDWPARLRERVEVLLVKDREFAEVATHLVFGDGGFDEALWQLPADNPSFANRERELEKMVRALEHAPAGGLLSKAVSRLFARATSSAVVGIFGPTMIGKTELAVHVAHQLADSYPDGCVVVDVGASQRTWPDNSSDAAGSASYRVLTWCDWRPTAVRQRSRTSCGVPTATVPSR